MKSAGRYAAFDCLIETCAHIDIYRTLDDSSALPTNGVERPHMAAILLQGSLASHNMCWQWYILYMVTITFHNQFHLVFKRFGLL